MAQNDGSEMTDEDPKAPTPEQSTAEGSDREDDGQAVADEEAVAPAAPRQISRLRPGGHGRALHLQVGDVLVGLDGIPYQKLPLLDDELDRRSAAAPSVLLHLYRNGHLFHLFTEAPLAAEFQPVEPELAEDLPEEFIFPVAGQLRTFEIFRTPAGDAQSLAQTPSLMITLCPPFWMLGLRAFEGAMIATITIAVAATVHILLGLAVYGLVCLYVGRDFRSIARALFSRQGYRSALFLADANERSAQQTASALDPTLRFIY